MFLGGRLSRLLLVLALVGAPALVLRILCVGGSCHTPAARAQGDVPFCSLPKELRRSIAAGFREGRSPEVMGATAGPGTVRTTFGKSGVVPWPGGTGTGATPARPDDRVPLVFFGGGVAPHAISDGVLLDSVAPTLEEIVGIRRDHPNVRTGEAIVGVAEDAGASPLVVLIAWKGLGTPDLETSPEAWPFLRRAIRTGAGTTEATTGSLPLDPAATLTTIGSGALPASHGITGTLVRDVEGEVRRAWSGRDAGSVIATFADDLDRDRGGEPRIAAVLTDPTDRGIVGDGWYLDGTDHDTIVQEERPARHVRLARAIVGSERLGRDRETDLLGVVLAGSVEQVDSTTSDLVDAVRRLVPDTTFVVAGTGSNTGTGGIEAAALSARVDQAMGAPVVQRAAADGLFLERDVLVERRLTTQAVADALRSSGRGEPLFADVYPSFAVALSRYC
ncbi:MAG TPA: hypothetical protein VFP41_00315 [Actinomycetota bacterium]|nr:hypothetical protein [Actinomycetota bacterium]